MSRRAFAAAALAALAALVVPTFPDQALAHEGNPNYRSDITGIPAGVDARMLNFDDTIQVDVDPGHELIVAGYEDEPYVRYLEDGTVEVNVNSPAYYLNEDRFAEVEEPASADADAEPEWERVGAQGTYSWHDHRVHYMAKDVPGQVTDESEETKIFDWTVPVELDGEREQLSGTLYWVGEDGGASAALVAGLGAGVLASLAFAVWRIRKRNAGEDRGDTEEATEAW
jgi:hypothetical protein